MIPTTEPSTVGRVPARGARLRYRRVHLASLVAEVPSEELRTAQIEDQLAPLYRKLGFKPGWVEAVTGIGARRMWADGQSSVDGAVAAASAALHRAGVSPDEIGAVVSCAVFRPRLEPSIACEVQGALGIGRHCMNHDVGNACLGFLSGLVQVANMIELGQIEAGLVVASEDARPVVRATIDALTRADATIHTFKDNLATLTLGSAASAAVLVSDRRARQARPLHGGTTLSATHHHDLCVGDAGGMITDSVRLLREGVALANQTWAEVTDLLQWDPEQVTTFAMHQVGKAHHDAVCRQLRVLPERAPQIYPWLGNVGACGVPVTAALAADQGVIQPGHRTALMGIGSGINCMMLGVTW